ncbi:MAG: L-dopachrome tautomerase-related protein, partial [Pseudomonadota bacterium]
MIRSLATVLLLAQPIAAAEMEIVAELDQGPGNVTITPDGRTILSLHQFYEPDLRVVELLPDGRLVPFPTRDWAGPRNGDIGLTAVLGLRAGQDGVVWLLDNGGGDATLARLVGWDTADDALHGVIEVPAEASIDGSFHNDLALDGSRPLAYLADIAGGIGVVNLETGEGWRALDDHPSSAAEDIDFVVRGEVLTDPEGAAVRTALNPITISPDDQWVYYGAMNGTSLYRVPTAALADPEADAAAQVERYGPKPPSDGITIDAGGNVYVTDGGGNAIGVTRPDGDYEALVVDSRIEWPDGLSAGPDGWIYATVNRLNNAPPLNGGETTPVAAPY